MPGNTGRTLLCRDAAGRSVVLKLTPERDIAATEAAALRAWAGCSRVVDLIDTDLDAGALLLRGIVPGTPLDTIDGPLPLAAVGAMLGELASVTPPPDTFPSLARRVEFMFALAERRRRGSPGESRLPLPMLRRSRAAALELAHGGPVALLHGDLHPGNVLDGGPGNPAVLIDPRPCVGDPAFDAVDWAVLPLAEGEELTDGIDALREHLPTLDADRVRRWCACLAVLVAMGKLRRTGPDAHTDALLRLAP
nr:aminoglycoside phosphotransferase family protein [Amycolatopsis anabasis]